ncbi:arf-GAP with dual PH domain-containing protein 1-like isoform 3-T3 [Clarias gariepinus]|uniref:arf-GAP with dual PH domain-containing protein 1-like isoform X3 n=1 Tax=Clarias gariepinus TaxID=13013 RepID=UPI00234DCC0A|nr:arf-GAP with dual PH domain-containing protein 1-like isoform X3 [Clarias gariepinus]
MSSMASEEETNRRWLRVFLDRPGNGCCADCGAPGPEWASFTLGVFMCQCCSGIHRSIPQISRVKSIFLDPWEKLEVELMSSIGNSAAKAKYEQMVPAFYYMPTHTDCQLLREQWIRSKYERNEFIYVERQEPYSAGYREGFLWKRGRDNSQFLSRKFILSEREGAMKYFNKHDEIVDWFNAIRAARFHYLQVAFPGASDTELVTKLTRNYIKEGYMEKTGPKQTEGFKRRWFTLDDRRIMYFKDPLDAYARGEVFIGSKESGYTVVAGLPPSTQGYHWQFGITIVTPDRKFLFACEKEEEQKEWITVFQSVINRPMLPQEYAVEAHFKHKP